MKVEELIKKIEHERVSARTEAYSAEGLVRLQEVAQSYQGEFKLIWSDDLLEKIKNSPKKPVHKFGLNLLDDLIGGFKEQQLITISAHTKHGKTAFGIFTLDVFSGLNPVMIPLEQSNEEIIEQRYDNGYSIPRFLSPEKLAAKVTVDWIEQRVVEGIAKYNTKLVLIDHLGYINDFGEDGEYRRENKALRTGEVMRGLKNVAKRWNVIIILLAHIHQHNESFPPSLEDIKNSSDIIQESDKVLMLWRKNEQINKIRIYKNETLVSVMANRQTGKNGNVGLKFNSQTGLYEEDNGWVAKMEEDAKQEMESNDNFNSF